jgi:hypothetical protein
MTFTRTEYDKFARPSYGSSNPERIDNPVWLAAIAAGQTAYQIRKQQEDTVAGEGSGSGHSSYRERAAGPVWTWQRFGRTTSRLPDGRQIHIGGEHEDWYDLDFCIYNDVVVEHPDQRCEIFGYPKSVFPPTDFHTATLIGETIWIVGSLGYFDLRRPGDTQIVTLDTRTLAIKHVASVGDCPSWLHRHWAELTADHEILVGGGQLIEPSLDGQQLSSKANDACFAFNPKTKTWRRVDGAGPLLLGISAEEYQRLKSPRQGTGNPERIDNPFWSVMAARQLLPRRARDLYSDRGTEPTEQERSSGNTAPRPIGEIVWTAVREEQAEVHLPNRGRLLIGGRFNGFGRDAIDRWVYNDAMLLQPDGAMTFLLYPRDVLPALHTLEVTYHNDRVFLSGTPDRILAAHWPQFRSIVFELDRATFALRRIGGPGNTPEDMIVGPGRPEPDSPNRLTFPIIRRWPKDPVREAILDVSSEKWRMRIKSNETG